MSDLLVRAARGERTERPPVWLMRQAGRYIPEYRDIRSDYSFKEAIKTPEVAERITLLPWDLFEPDGLVMFSDILTVLEPLGFDYHIESGVGPVVSNPVAGPNDVPTAFTDVATEIDYVGKLLTRLQKTYRRPDEHHRLSPADRTRWPRTPSARNPRPGNRFAASGRITPRRSATCSKSSPTPWWSTSSIKSNRVRT